MPSFEKINQRFRQLYVGILNDMRLNPDNLLAPMSKLSVNDKIKYYNKLR
jgi:hypothetical protein